MTAAIDLFGSRGYAATRIEDIGERVGITGPAVYEYFPRKADLLAAALNRGIELSEIALNTALDGSTSPGHAMRRVIAGYARAAQAHPVMPSLLLSEVAFLDPDDARQIRRIQREYVGQWVLVLRAHRPELDEAGALHLVHAVIALVNRAARIPALRTRTDIVELLTDLGSDVLDLAATTEPTA